MSSVNTQINGNSPIITYPEGNLQADPVLTPQMQQTQQQIMELYGEKDRVTQRLRQIPKTHVTDGAVIGTVAGLSTSAFIAHAGSEQRHFQTVVRDWLQHVNLDGQQIKPDHLEIIRRKAQGVLDAVADTQLTEYVTKALGFFDSDKLTSTIQQQVKQFGIDPQKSGGLVNQLRSEIEKLATQGNLTPENVELNEKLAKAFGDNLEAAKAFVANAANNMYDLQHGEIASALRDKAVNEIDKGFISQVISKIPFVHEDSFRNTAGRINNGTFLEKAGTVAAITGVVVAVAVTIKHFADRGKNEEREIMKSHVQRLDEQIAREQEQFKSQLAFA